MSSNKFTGGTIQLYRVCVMFRENNLILILTESETLV